jgi:predicted DCC family thiol-disulfide oxidoreductase YuxK
VTAGASRPAPPVSWTLIYDGDCDFCRRCIRLLHGWDRGRRVRTVPFQDQAALSALPPIPAASLEAAMHLVGPDGSVHVGAAAAPVILRLLPGGSVLAAAFRLPGVPAAAERVYRAVARNRHRPGCGSPRCRRGG